MSVWELASWLHASESGVRADDDDRCIFASLLFVGLLIPRFPPPPPPLPPVTTEEEEEDGKETNMRSRLSILYRETLFEGSVLIWRKSVLLNSNEVFQDSEFFKVRQGTIYAAL